MSLLLALGVFVFLVCAQRFSPGNYRGVLFREPIRWTKETALQIVASFCLCTCLIDLAWSYWLAYLLIPAIIIAMLGIRSLITTTLTNAGILCPSGFFIPWNQVYGCRVRRHDATRLVAMFDLACYIDITPYVRWIVPGMVRCSEVKMIYPIAKKDEFELIVRDRLANRTSPDTEIIPGLPRQTPHL